MGIGSAVGKAVGKQMSDIFGDYSLKSSEVAAKSTIGVDEAVPASKHIKNLKTRGVTEEEINDLGLNDLGDTLLTRDELMAEIDARRSNVSGQLAVSSKEVKAGKLEPSPHIEDSWEHAQDNLMNLYLPSPEDIGTTFKTRKQAEMMPNVEIINVPEEVGVRSLGVNEIDELGQYGDFIPEIGSARTYKYLKYNKPEFRTSDGDVIKAEHGNTPNQLFHLRLNTGVSRDGEKVTNLLEVQSDPGQPIAMGQAPKIEGMPFINEGNWQILGMKEAVKQAKREGSRYLAIAPGEEIAFSVGNRLKTIRDANVKIVKSTSKKGDYYTYKSVDGEKETRPVIGEFTGFIENEFNNIPTETLDTFKQLLEDLDLFKDLKRNKRLQKIFSDYDLNTENGVRKLYVDVYKIAAVDQATFMNRELTSTLLESLNITKNNEDAFKHIVQKHSEKVLDDLSWGDKNHWDDLEDELVEGLWSQEFINASETLRDNIHTVPLMRFHPKMSRSEVAKNVGLDPKEVDKAVEEGAEFILPKGAHGGQGIIDFYDEKLIGKKRLKKYKAPLVRIEVDRPDGTYVEVNALDLKDLPDDPKKIPYELYAIAAANVGGLAKGVMEAQESAEEKQTSSRLQMAKGGFVEEEDMKKAPVGALNEEVADNIDADLSEGEFVFPADVVRYVGLDKLMEIRQDAKQGLAKMAAMGQMSNADEAVIPDDVPHEAMSEEGKYRFATGGAVTANPPASNIPTYYGQQTPSYMQPTAVQTAPQYSGQQQTATQSVYQPNQFTQVPAIGLPQPATAPAAPSTTPSTGSQGCTTPYEMKRFGDDKGNAVYIPFVNCQPQIPVPEGYKETSRIGGTLKQIGEATPESERTASDVGTARVTSSGDGDDSWAGDPNSSTTGGTSSTSNSWNRSIGDTVSSSLSDLSTSVMGDDVGVGVARAMAETNPSIQENLDTYNQYNYGKWAASLASFALGIPGVPSAVFKKGDEWAKEERANLMSALPSDVQRIIAMNEKAYGAKVAGDPEQAYKDAIAAGASQVTSAELAGRVDDPFYSDFMTSYGTPGGLSSYEASVANMAPGMGVGTQQTAMLTSQEMGLFNSVAEREAFLRGETPIGTAMLDVDRVTQMQADYAAETGDIAGTSFGSVSEASAVSTYGFASDEHFAAIDNEFASISDSSGNTGDGGAAAGSQAEADNFMSADFDSISASGISGDSGSGSGSGDGSYCCTKMVNHGIWTTRREFALMHKWHREQPQWWRDGYDVWGKILAEKFLADNNSFWTSVMHEMYQHLVRNKKLSLKSALAYGIMYPGVFAFGMLAKVTGRHVNEVH